MSEDEQKAFNVASVVIAVKGTDRYQLVILPLSTETKWFSNDYNLSPEHFASLIFSEVF